MKQGIYVGSFNPVHNDHIRIANYAANNCVDIVRIIPTGAYWDKTNLIDIKDRINMLKFFESDKIIIDTEHNNMKYTYEIMRALNDGSSELYLIIGADSIVNFHKWVNYQELLQYGLIIFGRSDIDVQSYLNTLGKKDNYIIVNDFDSQDVSSTKIREYLSAGSDLIDTMVDKNVLKYIEDNGLYK